MKLGSINLVGAFLMYMPSVTIMLLLPAGLSIILAIIPIVMVTVAVMVPHISKASISLRYYSIVPVLIVILFSRGFIASQIAAFPYIGTRAGLLVGIGFLSWEAGLIVTQYAQTAMNARTNLLEHGYEESELDREFSIFRNQIFWNLGISAVVSLFLYIILLVVPKIRTNIFILIIIFLVVYISLSRIFVRSDRMNAPSK